MPGRIPCLVFAWFDFESFQATMHCLLRLEGRLDLMVVENHSPATEALFRPYLLDLLKQGRISRYFCFLRNITSNALEVLLDGGLVDLETHERFILTDGDLLIHDDSWLDEELGILDRNPDVFTCGINLDLCNLPVHVYPEAARWIPPARAEHADYTEVTTGIQLLMFRSREMTAFLDYRREKQRSFVDATMHDYCYRVIGKKWARTKKNSARHLAWDRYADLTHPYTKATKLSRTTIQTWYHSDYCSCEVHTAGGVTIHRPIGKMLGGRMASLYRSMRRIARTALIPVLGPRKSQ